MKRIRSIYSKKFTGFTWVLLVFLACKDKNLPTGMRQDNNYPPAAYTKLVWSDEFDGKTVDLAKWEFEVNDKGGGNNELQYYTARPENAFNENGNLVIKANKENYLTRNYTSARMRTRNKGDWKFGKIEVRAKLPKGQGIWPAIWMLPTDEVYGGWPKSGEIDIMEVIGNKPNELHGTIHYGSDWPNNKHMGTSITLPAGDFSDDFHVFSIVWEKDLIRWFLDGNQYFSVKPADLAPEKYPFNERFHLILNLAVGGNWPGNPDAATVFPQQMLVDYVRVYQK